jgi:hypothetical protein
MRQVLIVVAAVLLLRLPFLNQAIQGDDIYYLAGAAHAQVDPLHPAHTRFVFMGDVVDMRGHSHPPLNAGILGLLVALTGGVREVPFHAAYILFSVIAALSVLSLARRFSPRPLWAVLLFLAAPAFVVNGNSLEADLPFLAFWLASLALAGRVWAVVPLGLAALTAFQGVFLTPVLLLHTWLYARKSRLSWALAFTPVAAIGAWQLFELFFGGRLPASVLTGYFSSYGFQALSEKLRNAVMLSLHSLWIVFPALLVPAAVGAWKRRGRDTVFLAGWIAIFFAGALAVFFAGSARYLLPIAAPLALLASWARPRWLALGFACQMALAMGLALVNYDHWNGYRRFAASLSSQTGGHRVWVNGEWGLRYYLEQDGGLPLVRGQAVRPGDIVVSSALAYPVEFTTGGGALTPIAEREIGARLPLRLIGLDSRSGYSTVSKGFLPFGISRGPIDRVRAELVVERKPESAYLTMGSPESARQIVSGLYQVEDGRWRWAAERAVVLLKSPARAAVLRVVLAIPDMAPGRNVTVLADDRVMATAHFDAPGLRTIDSAPFKPRGDSTPVAIVIDRTFSVPGDRRKLGFILTAAGFIDSAGGPAPAP